jgi:NAD(P)-dependent dehydrogenase (short-subunit alcohol dehydrogenase family)
MEPAGFGPRRRHRADDRGQGGKVVLADVNKEAGEALAAELGANARFVATDVTGEESAKGAFAAAVELGTLRGLVNCAGVAPAEKVVGRDGAHKLESFARTININLVGSFNMIRLAAEIMSKNEAQCRRRARRDRQHRLGGGL